LNPRNREDREAGLGPLVLTGEEETEEREKEVKGGDERLESHDPCVTG